MSRKNFHCPTCGTKLNTDSNMDICHICGTDVSDIVNNILIGQEEDGPCGDCGDDINSPYYLGSREDIYEVEGVLHQHSGKIWCSGTGRSQETILPADSQDMLNTRPCMGRRSRESGGAL